LGARRAALFSGGFVIGGIGDFDHAANRKQSVKR
jgi:hypothetical protein